jgi:phage-related protein
MLGHGPELAVQFFVSALGNEPAREWIRAQEEEVRVAIGRNIRIVQRNWPIGMPLVRAFGSGLFEVRTTCRGDVYRVMFAVRERNMFVLHAFQKKTRATPQADLEIARKRYKEMMS